MSNICSSVKFNATTISVYSSFTPCRVSQTQVGGSSFRMSSSLGAQNSCSNLLRCEDRFFALLRVRIEESSFRQETKDVLRNYVRGIPSAPQWEESVTTAQFAKLLSERWNNWLNGVSDLDRYIKEDEIKNLKNTTVDFIKSEFFNMRLLQDLASFLRMEAEKGSFLAQTLGNLLENIIGVGEHVDLILAKGEEYFLRLREEQISIQSLPPAEESLIKVQKPSLIIVDDDRMVGRAVSRQMGGQFDVVGVFTNPQEFLDDFKSGMVAADLYLVDIMMPQMTGVELYMKMLAGGVIIPEQFLFISGGVFSPTIKDFFDTSRIPLIEKPLTKEGLGQALLARLEASKGKK